MSSFSVDIVLDFMGFPPDKAWELLLSSHLELFCGTKACELSGRACYLGSILTRIKRSGNSDFEVMLNDIEFHYAHIKNFDHSVLWLRNAARDSDDAWDWIKPFASAPYFRQAFVYDDVYNYWQNAQDPLEFKARGRSMSGLKMKSNGLPPPLEQKIVDTSSNPGRRVVRRGYVEAVAHLMWMGNQFWSLTGVPVDQVCGSRIVQCEIVSQDVVRLQCSKKPFTSARGSEAALQNELRSLLYTPSLRK